MLFLCSFCWSLPNLVALSLRWLLLNICLTQHQAPLCFTTGVSTFPLKSTSASLFFPCCLFHLVWLSCFLGSVWWMQFVLSPFKLQYTSPVVKSPSSFISPELTWIQIKFQVCFFVCLFFFKYTVLVIFSECTPPSPSRTWSDILMALAYSCSSVHTWGAILHHF